DGWLHGRGAADMKSGIAAMVGACRQFLQEAPLQQGSIALLLTSDEEGPAVNGVAQVVQKLKQRGDIPDWTLVCEPSSKEHPGDRIRVGRRGSLHGHLVITGLQGHVAYPDAVRNPIHGVGRFVDALAGQDFSRDEQDFPPTSLQITNINAGTGALNVVPGELRADFNLRYSPQITATEIQQTVERLLVQQVGAHFDARIDWVQAAAPFYSKSGLLRQAAVTAIQQVTGEAPEVSTSGGTSDGRFMQPAGSEVIELGPSAATIHQIDERIRIDSLAVIEDCYLEILKLLFRPST
ncbi:MAG: succinyl-diaminopimelate desuccinylase, partial [Gammaproteobacteria bacterium]